ncbi:unnamed protein product [Rodentolepis nana]|uniref:DUF4201 domain-containing protein n=1 Tax=Rodentolepis nana TaxID=102285 RepID=A0A0R3TKC0_RODNA|nr:unnamed protein product [Rodentolepis nana]
MSSTESYCGPSHRVHSAYESRSLPNSPHSNELLSNEPPSSDVLEFYRQKVAILAADDEYFQKQLDEISEAIDHQHSLRIQLQEKEDAIMNLKNQISKLETDLHAERNHVLRLYAENDRLKLREIDARRMIEQLKRLADMSFATPSSCSSLHRIGVRRDPLEGYIDENEKMLGKEKCEPDLDNAQRSLVALQKQFTEQTMAFEERIQSLLVDQERRIRDEGERAEMYRTREAELFDQLKRSQLILREMVSEYLHLRLKHRISEKAWIAEKEELIGCINLGVLDSKLDLFQNKPTTFQLNSTPLPRLFKTELSDELNYEKLEGFQKREWELRRTIEELEAQFDQQHKLVKRYRNQVLQIEETKLKIMEECSQSKNICNSKIKQLKERSQLCTKRYEDLERRRKHEIEGYQTDIRSLKRKLADAESKLRQVIQEAETETGTLVKDRNPWKTIKMSAETPRSKFLEEELWKLKDLMHVLSTKTT